MSQAFFLPASGPTPEDRQSERTVLSVNFFYTNEFERDTADPEGYEDTLPSLDAQVMNKDEIRL